MDEDVINTLRSHLEDAAVNSLSLSLHSLAHVLGFNERNEDDLAQVQDAANIIAEQNYRLDRGLISALIYYEQQEHAHRQFFQFARELGALTDDHADQAFLHACRREIAELWAIKQLARCSNYWPQYLQHRPSGRNPSLAHKFFIQYSNDSNGKEISLETAESICNDSMLRWLSEHSSAILVTRVDGWYKVTSRTSQGNHQSIRPVLNIALALVCETVRTLLDSKNESIEQ